MVWSGVSATDQMSVLLCEWHHHMYVTVDSGCMHFVPVFIWTVKSSSSESFSKYGFFLWNRSWNVPPYTPFMWINYNEEYSTKSGSFRTWVGPLDPSFGGSAFSWDAEVFLSSLSSWRDVYTHPKKTWNTIYACQLYIQCGAGGYIF